MDAEETDRRQLLKDEYLHVQSVIEIYDGKMLTIKTWSVTVSMAAIGGAYVSKSVAVLALAALSALIFWIIEGFWKTFQYAHYDRSGKIEKYFAGAGGDIWPMQIGRSWYVNWKKGGFKRLVRVLGWPHVLLPHLAVVGLALILLAFHFSGLVSVDGTIGNAQSEARVESTK